MANFLLTELINVHELLGTLLSNTSPEFYQPTEMIQAALNRAILVAEFLSGGEGPANATVNPDRNMRDSSRKRNRLPEWKEQVKALPGSSMDRPPEDGIIWRKYGQKEILNSAFPRCYYRCTFKYSHRCPATKQVQRSDKDPTTFNIIYNGEHVCGQRAISAPPPQRNFSTDCVITQGLVGSPVSPLESEIVLLEPNPVNSESPFVSFSGADAAHFTPDEIFHGWNHAGAWEHDNADMLCGATYATSTYDMDYGIFHADDFGQSFFPYTSPHHNNLGE